jgi:hypothetical protein
MMGSMTSEFGAGIASAAIITLRAVDFVETKNVHLLWGGVPSRAAVAAKLCGLKPLIEVAHGDSGALFRMHFEPKFLVIAAEVGQNLWPPIRLLTAITLPQRTSLGV